MAFLLWFAMACSDDGARLAEARAACGLKAPIPAPVTMARRYTGLGSGCVQVADDALGVEWWSFPGDPEFGDAPQEEAQLLLAGFATVFSWEGPPVAEVLDSELMPQAVLDWIQARVEEGELEPADSSNAVWLALLDESVDRAVFDPDLEAYMSYRALDDNLTVAPLTSSHPERAASASPWGVAASLMHEASHALIPGHDLCVGGGEGCDHDNEGAYAFEVAWLVLWWRANADVLDAASCEEHRALIWENCAKIYTPGGFAACDLEACPG